MKSIITGLFVLICFSCFSQMITTTEFYFELGDTVTNNHTSSNNTLAMTDSHKRILLTQIEDNTGKIITIDMSGIASEANMVTILFEKDRYASQLVY